MAWTRIAQWVGCVGIGVYGVFFMDWGREMGAKESSNRSGPFEGARRWLDGLTGELTGARESVGNKIERNGG